MNNSLGELSRTSCCSLLNEVFSIFEVSQSPVLADTFHYSPVDQCNIGSLCMPRAELITQQALVQILTLPKFCSDLLTMALGVDCFLCSFPGSEGVLRSLQIYTCIIYHFIPFTAAGSLKY